MFSQISVLSAGPAQAEVVSSIVVQGGQRIDAETVKNYVLIKPGQNFTPNDINESIKALYATGLFSDVKIAKRGNSLVVTVAENNVVGSVRFEGNKKLKDDMLSAVIETKPRGILSDAKLQSDVERLKEAYKRNGRAEATVEVQTIPRDTGRTDVVFKITEGTRTGISSINFVGNKAFSSGRLRNVMTIKRTDFTSWLSKRDQFDEAKLQADEELIRRMYMRNGFADFRIVNTDVAFDEVKNRYNITITIEEGPRYTFGSVQVDSSIASVVPASLMPYVQTKSGKVFNADLVQKSTEKVSLALLSQGHSFAQVRPRGDRDYANHTINVTYLVDEGPRLYVERLDIRGNTRTRDYVIRREFNISEGDAYNKALIDQAERRLKNLGYFKTVNIATQPGSSPDRVIVVVNVEDQSTGSFSVGGGYTTDQGGGFIATVALTEKNFLGRGQYLKVSVGGGASDRTFNVSWTEPFFLGRRMSFGFDALYNQAEQTDYRPYNMNTWGGTLRLGLPITDEWNVQFNYKLAQRDVTSWGSEYLADWGAFAQLYPKGSWINSSVGYVLTYTTIDNFQNPRNGTFVQLAQDFAGLGGDGQFIRSTIDARYYKEIMPDSDMVGLIKAGAGNIMGLGGQDVQVLDNFYRGGETIRGFASYGYGARYLGNVSNYAIGGTTYYNVTAELQFPLPLMPEEFGLRGAVFADAGTLYGYEGLEGLNIEDSSMIRSSVGASIIWNSPFGILRGDFGQALTKATYDQTQVFRFSAGTQF
ncbi:outer membrane protein assembly factor BamA [Kaistia algarum]|uniref:outer membrane protein assembly factor BamA n=1 Tax=Kaistia algarum TaxID=2083279 RepID=UPI002255D8A0|nr:outer membrane protein assembly factor BamA [Kaistia algarum]